MRRLFAVGAVVAVLACPAWAIYHSNFDAPTYTMGPLIDGQDGWTAGASGNTSIWVDMWAGSGTVQINPYRTSGNEDVYHALNAANPAAGDTVDIDILPGIGTAGNCWYMWTEENNGNQASWWYGGISSAQARIGGSVTAVPGGITGLTTLRTVIDIPGHKTDYYYDKHDGNGMIFLATKAGYAANSLDKIHVQAYARGYGDTWAFFDNLVPEPATLTLLGLALPLLRRRR